MIASPSVKFFHEDVIDLLTEKLLLLEFIVKPMEKSEIRVLPFANYLV